jgi:hypothetical protein
MHHSHREEDNDKEIRIDFPEDIVDSNGYSFYFLQPKPVILVRKFFLKEHSTTTSVMLLFRLIPPAGSFPQGTKKFLI